MYNVGSSAVGLQSNLVKETWIIQYAMSKLVLNTRKCKIMLAGIVHHLREF